MVNEEDAHAGAVDSDIAGVYEASLERHQALGKSPEEFYAWHHPRKQWVRVQQWCAAVRDLLSDLSLGANSSFNYLTLPGDELLDIRALHGVLEREKRKLRYLGFNALGGNATAQAELNLSRNEVSSLRWIDPFSHVEEDRLETIANVKSAGYDRLVDVGGFHAINLDFCDSLVFKEPNNVNGTALDALDRIIKLQIQSTTPWLLFITTKIEPGLIAESVKQGFEEAIRGNINSSDEFAERFRDAVGVEACEAEAREEVWATSGEALVRLFATGLGKWLLSLLCTTEPPRRFRLLSSCVYKSGHTTNMLSIAFRCDTPPVEVSDRYGIFEGKGERAPENASEVELGIELAKAMRNCFDLDVRLANDSELAEKLIGQAARLLSTARHDPENYTQWARHQVWPACRQ